MTAGTFRPRRMAPLLTALAGGERTRTCLAIELGWPAAVLQKTLENARTLGFAETHTKPDSHDKVWRLTADGFNKVFGDSAPRPANSVFDLAQEKLRADAAVRRLAQTGEGGADGEAALPPIAAAEVSGLPVFECDIDAVHRTHERRGQRVSAEKVAAQWQPLLRPVVEDEPPFLCALYSDGRLLIESHGYQLLLPLEQTRRLLRYLEGLACDAVLADADAPA